MNKKMALMGLGLSMLVQHSFSDNVGFLVNIFNKSPYAVRLQTTDQASTIVKMDGSQLSANDIKDKPFNLADISSFNYRIPWGSWDGQARIYIDVLRDYSDSNSLIARYELMERDGMVELWKLTNGYDQNSQKAVRFIPRNQPTQYSLLVDEAGEVSFPLSQNGKLILTTKNSPKRISFMISPYHKTIQIGSPNCSMEKDLSKQFQTVSAHQASKVTMFMKDQCKIVVNLLDDEGNQTSESATACFGFAQKDTKGRWQKDFSESYINYHEIPCNDPACAPDPDTGISPCDKIGLSWVEGLNPSGARVNQVGPNDYEAYYGIVDTSQ